MNVSAFSCACLGGIGLVAAASAAPALAQASGSMAQAGELDPSAVQSLPEENRTGPVVYSDTESSIGADGVETITRTRRIESSTRPHARHNSYYAPGSGYAPDHTRGYMPGHGYRPAAAVFQRDQWLEECERRTDGRDDREKGGIIGGLLGAITGGIAGNRIAGSGERLGGTLIGAGVGGLGGLLIGSIIGGGRDRNGNYDCEAALDSYLSQYGRPGSYVPTTHSGYGHTYAQPYPAYGYSYAPPPQIVYVPVEYYQQQRVIVRETVREEVIPRASRSVPAPAPAPRPVKARPIPVKGY